MIDLRRQLEAYFRKQPSSVALWLKMVAVVSKVARSSGERLKSRGLSPAQFNVIVQIGKYPGLSQQDIAKKVLVTKGNVSQLLAKLEQQQLVRREQGGVTNSLYLTNRGCFLLQEILPAYDRFIVDCFAELSEIEQETLMQLLNKLDQGIG